MDVLEEAIAFGVKAHHGQTRKFSNIPYILHPLEVAAIIATMTEDREVMAAGVLHDTVEDCGVDPLEIRKLFGPRVAALVAGESEDKMVGRNEADSWMDRKQESLLMLEHTKDRDVRIMWLADKLSNMRSFYRTFLVKGDEMWQSLHQKDPKIQGWYYKTIADYVRNDLGTTAAFAEYEDLVRKVFG